MILKTLEEALAKWRAAETKQAIESAAQVVVNIHGTVLKLVRGKGPELPWERFPAARDFFTQWEAADITRVLVLGRRW